MSKDKKKKKTIYKFRHKFWYRLLRPLVRVFLWLKFGYRCKKARKLPKNYIVISNHTTDYDPLFVSSSFKRPMYFVASEHITRWNTAYKLLNWAFQPIVRYKGASASSTIMEMLRATKNGQNVCIFAEGVRSWNGVNSHISPSTAKLVKSAGCGLVTYRITGGYLTSPIWGESGRRKGYVRGEPVGVYTAEQLAEMSNEEVYDIIIKDTYENAFESQKVLNKKYKNKGLAEGIENVLFKCEKCGENDTLHSSGEKVTCSHCGHEMTYTQYGQLEGGKFENVLEYSNWQDEKIIEDVKKKVKYVASNAILSEVSVDHSKEMLAEGELSLDKDSLRCGEFEIATKDITDMAVFGRHGLVFSCGKDYYELRPDKSVSVIKFLKYYNECMRALEEKD